MKDSSDRATDNLKSRKNRKTVGVWLFFIFIVVFFVLVSRLMIIAVGKNVKNVNLNSEAQKLYTQTQTLKAKRGTIYDANGSPIAEDTSTYSLYAVLDKSQIAINNKPLYDTNKTKTAKILPKYIT
ncbi:MAG: hypothetical protein ABF908_11825 [Lentilactobacillus diolivorans]